MLSQLSAEAEQSSIRCLHIIVDDCSDNKSEYQAIVDKSNSPHYQIRLLRNMIRLGREGFWRTWNSLFEAAKRIRFQMAICLADDMILCDSFLIRSMNLLRFSCEQDARCCAVNLMSLHPFNWGTNRWIDGAFIASTAFFHAIQWRINQIRPDRWQGERMAISSGVWQQVTRRLAATRYRIAPVCGLSLAMSRQSVDSQMFPRERFPDRKETEFRWACNFVGDLPP